MISITTKELEIENDLKNHLKTYSKESKIVITELMN